MMDELDERIKKLAPREADGVACVGVIIDRDSMRALVCEMDRLHECNAILGTQRTEWEQERTILLKHIASLEKKP